MPNNYDEFKQGFMCTHNDHGGVVNSVCVTSDGQFVISCSSNKSIIVWERSQGDIIPKRQIFIHTSNVASIFAIPRLREFISGSHDSTINRFIIRNERDVDEIKLNYARPPSEKNSKILAVYCISDVDNPSSITVFNASKCNIIVGYTESEAKYFELNRHTNCVRCLCGTSDGKYLISGSADKTIRIWDWRNQVKDDTRQLFESLQVNVLEGHQDKVRSICITPDDTRIISGSNDKTVRVWDRENGLNILTLQGHTDAVRTVCMSTTGDQIISGGQDCMIRLWDLDTGAAIRILEGHEYWVRCLCTIPGTPLIVSGSSDGTVRIWNMSANPLLASYDNKKNNPIISIAYLKSETETENRFVSSSKQLSLWVERKLNLHDTDNILTCTTHTHSSEEVTCMCVTRNKCQLITGTILTNTSLIKSYYVILWIIDKNIFKIYRKYTGHIDIINSIYCTDDEIMSGSDDKTVQIWKNIRNLGKRNVNDPGGINKSYKHDSAVVAVTIIEKKDNTVLYVSSSTDNMVRICDENCKLLFMIEGLSSMIVTLTMTFDNNYLLTGSYDYTIKSWKMITDEEKELNEKEQNSKKNKFRQCDYSFIGHTDVINAIICHENNIMISASDDKNIIIWDLNDGKKLRTLCGHDASVTCMCISPDHKLLSGSKDGMILTWDLSVGRNVPPDVELSTLILSYHKEKRYEDVMKVIQSFRCNGLVKTFKLDGISLVHWLVDSDRLMYVDFLLQTVFNDYPEAIFAYDDKDSICFLQRVLHLEDLRFTKNILRIFSLIDAGSFLSLAYIDNYALKRSLNSHLFVDIEELSQALERLGKFLPIEYLNGGVFSLQCSPLKSFITFDDLDDSDSLLVIGSSTLPKEGLRTSIKKDKFSEKRIRADQKFVPFCMRRCQYNFSMHSSTRFIAACIDVCNKTGDVSLFKSTALNAILDHKWNHYGFKWFLISFCYNLSIIIHFSIYSVLQPKLKSITYRSYHVHEAPKDWYIHFFWSLVLVAQVFLSIIVECAIAFIGATYYQFEVALNLLAYLSIYVSIGMGFMEVDPDATAVVSSIAFLILWCTNIFSLRYLDDKGLYLRVVLQIFRLLIIFFLLFVLYVLGFGYAMYLLFCNLKDSPYWSDDDVVRSHGGQFKSFIGSSMTIFFTVLGGSDWTVEQFIFTPSYVTASIFYIIFTIISVLFVNLSISIMSSNFSDLIEQVFDLVNGNI